MKIIGLTGGIASGKSTVSGILKSLGAVVIDADQVAREVVEPGQPAWQEIVDAFGPAVLNPDGTLNRKQLSQLVFRDGEKLRRLNAITHPRVIEHFRQRLQWLRANRPDAVVVLDVPLLFESGMDAMADEVWVVWVDQEIEMQRLMMRDGITHEEAQARVAAQLPLEEKVRRADRVIDNTRSLQETIAQTEALYRQAVAGAGVSR
ncbi:MAG: dephospho-CoA kinase [Syntrophomonadaceae bacterium]|nr:dephospho-CoA kinase [Syntrophomonadaceae bacterium]